MNGYNQDTHPFTLLRNISSYSLSVPSPLISLFLPSLYPPTPNWMFFSLHCIFYQRFLFNCMFSLPAIIFSSAHIISASSLLIFKHLNSPPQSCESFLPSLQQFQCFLTISSSQALSFVYNTTKWNDLSGLLTVVLGNSLVVLLFDEYTSVK